MPVQQRRGHSQGQLLQAVAQRFNRGVLADVGQRIGRPYVIGGQALEQDVSGFDP